MSVPRATSVLLFGLLVSLLSFVIVGEARAAFPGTNGKIAFESNELGQFDIYSINPDGTARSRLTKDAEVDVNPVWSAGGTRIAFDTRRNGAEEIYAMNADGTGLTRVTNNAAEDTEPAFSPDGTRIAFASTRDGDREIWVTNADGTGTPTNLTNNAVEDSDPAWSPDGQRILFESQRSGGGDIYVVGAAGGTQTRLTNNGATDANPSWEPNGNRFAFDSLRTANGDVYVKNLVLESSSSNPPTRITTSTVRDAEPAWSPQGDQIAFQAQRSGAASIEIYRINAAPESNANQPVRVTNNAVEDGDPDWGPQPSADLSITKADSPDPVVVGQDLTYTLTIRNNGPGAATGVTATDALPANTTFVSAGAGCTNANGTVTCNIGDLANGATATREIVVRSTAAAANTTLSNTANVQSNTADNTAANNSATATTQVNPAADLALTKTDSPDPVLVGQNLTYALTATNNGPNAATGVVITDTLPTNTAFVSASDDCTNADGTVTCNVGALANRATATREIVVRPTAAAANTTPNNTANVRSDTADPANGNNAASASTRVNPAADLGITKTDAPDPAVVGNELTYTLRVGNDGPNAAQNVTVTDDLPANATFVRSSSSQGADCASPAQGSQGGTVTCNLGNIAVNGTATVTIVVRPTAAGNIDNTARVSSGTADPNNANGNAAATTQVAAADLTITKDDAPDPVTFGQNLTYTISVSNTAGGPDARNVSVTDPLPENVEFVSAGNGCDFNGGNRTVACDLDVVAAGSTATREIVVRPTAAAVGTTLQNRATVRSPNDPSDSSATATTAVNAADLAVRKTDTPDPVAFGEDLTYTVSVTNNGAGAAQNVTVTDPLPQNVEFVSAGADCDFDGGNRTVTCDFGTLASGESASREIVVTPTAAAVATTVENTATARSPSNPDAARSSAATRVVAANLSATKTGPDSVLAGQDLTYEFSVTNNGPAAARNVTLTDVLPQGVTFNGPAPDGCAYDADSRRLTCDFGTLANGETVSRQISVTAPNEPGTIRNTATARSPNDPNGGRSSTAVTEVRAAADLSATKTASAQTTFGENLTYVLRADNAGPNAAANAGLIDTLPQDVEFVSAGANCDYTAQSRTVRCDLGTLAAGDSATRRIVVRPTAEAVGTTLSNAATARSETADPDESNNRSPLSRTRVVAADLAITKTDAPDPANVGQALTYTIRVVNQGEAGARDVAVTDALPDNVTFESVQSSQGDCQPPGGDRRVSCELGAVGPGEEATVTIVLTPARGAADSTLSNTARVTSPNDPTDGSATEQTRVAPAADLALTKEKAASGPATNGQPFDYRLTVTNNGPSAAENVPLTDDLPDGVTYNDADSTGSCELVDPAENIVQCTLAGALPAADDPDTGPVENRAVFVINVTPDQAGQVNNQASVESDTFDQNRGNNAAALTTAVDPAAGLAITKEKATPGPATFGEAFEYTITVTNNGPNAAQNVVVDDDLPDGLGYNDGASSQECEPVAGSQDPNDVRCALGDLESGATQTLAISVTPNRTGPVGNTATVRSPTTDPDNANNSATARDQVEGANLRIAKSDGTQDGRVRAGSRFTYTLTITNDGPAVAGGVTVADPLPADVTFVSVESDRDAPGDPACDDPNADRTVRCGLGTLDPGASAEVRITVTAPDEGSESIFNRATTRSPNDPNGDRDSERTTTAATGSADLSLQKQALERVTDEDTFAYTLTVENAGPSTARDVTVEDELPRPDVEFVSVTSNRDEANAPACSETDGTVECDLGDLAPNGGPIRIEITVRAKTPTPPNGGGATNEAEALSAVADPNEANNSDTANTRIDASADLSIDKEASAETVVDGEEFTYTLTVNNVGPSAAGGTSVTDTLPAGVRFVQQGTDERCSYDDGAPDNAADNTVTCDLNVVEPGGGPIALDIRVRAAEPGPQVNRATVASETSDPNQDNNTSREATTTVTAATDLVLRKQAPGTVTDGNAIAYALTVTNNGPSTAEDVVIRDTLPDGVSFESASEGCDYDAGTRVVTCDVGNLGPDEEARATITVRADEPGERVNRAAVASQTPERDPDDDADDATTTVRASADLSVSKSGPRTVAEGRTFAYTLTARNNGPSDAQNVRVTDDLPDGVALVSASSEQGACAQPTQPDGVVRCDLGNVAPTAEGPITITIRVRAKEPGAQLNTASVDSAATDDPDANNDRSPAVTTTVVAVADLSIEKQAPGTATDGGRFDYALAVENNGPSAARGVVVTDELPGGVRFVSADNCENRNGTVECAIGTLAPGASAGRIIRVEATSPGETENTARVLGETTDPNGRNDGDSATTRVRPKPSPRADLNVEVDAPRRVREGSNFVYAMTVTNNGPDRAADVRITSRLPGGMRFVRGPESCDYEPANRTLTCDLGDMSDGAKKVRKVVLKATGAGSVGLQSIVRSDAQDQNRANNSDSG